MKQEFYGAFVLSPLQVLTNLDGAITAQEQNDVALFRSASSAFGYIGRKAQEKAIQAHTVAMGDDLNEFHKLRGVGIMYRLSVPDEVIRQMNSVSPEERYQGMQCKGDITGSTKLEQQAVFVADEFHSRPIEIIPMTQVKEELMCRAQNYEPLDVILANTPVNVRRQFSPQLMFPEALQMSIGPDAPSRHGFTTEYPQDQKFWDIHKMLWEKQAGIQYIVERTPFLYDRYRDVYARNHVTGCSSELSSAKAALVVLNQLSELATSYRDTKMEEILQEAGEQATLDVLSIEREERGIEEI